MSPLLLQRGSWEPMSGWPVVQAIRLTGFLAQDSVHENIFDENDKLTNKAGHKTIKLTPPFFLAGLDLKPL
jgi:hypothetical protein